MGLNIVKPNTNMYQGWITHTWNTVKGACPHDCEYCYMKKWGKLNPVRLDEKELNTDLGQGNFIFVGSSCDMFADDIPNEWIIKTLEYCGKYKNTYLFQTKNPEAFDGYASVITALHDFALCTTIETNRVYPDIMGNTPSPADRAMAMGSIPWEKKYVTIEPIMDFDLAEMIHFIRMCDVKQCNIGGDSGDNGLPEPSTEKIVALIGELEKFTTVKLKKNLKRLL